MSKKCCNPFRKLAKHTHVAGANCCSSFKNVFTKCKKHCHCDRCRGGEIFVEE